MVEYEALGRWEPGNTITCRFSGRLSDITSPRRQLHTFHMVIFHLTEDTDAFISVLRLSHSDICTRGMNKKNVGRRNLGNGSANQICLTVRTSCFSSC